MKIRLTHKFEDIININNLLLAWQEFIKDKGNKKDTQEFKLNLIDNIINLHDDLNNLGYKNGGYQAFKINDPKPRNIHKAIVRDRLLHYAIYRMLYHFFDRTFIADSYSCRIGKANYKAINRFRSFVYKVLINILRVYIPDQNIMWLLERIINSFCKTPNKGLPLGNLTSQLFVNIYMNEFD